MSDSLWDYLPLTDLSYQILLVLAKESLHGYGILQAIAARTDGQLEPDTGTLYTAIRRLQRNGLLQPIGERGGRLRGRRYRLTALGRKVVRLESQRLAALLTEARALHLLRDES